MHRTYIHKYIKIKYYAGHKKEAGREWGGDWGRANWPMCACILLPPWNPSRCMITMHQLKKKKKKRKKKEELAWPTLLCLLPASTSDPSATCTLPSTIGPGSLLCCLDFEPPTMNWINLFFLMSSLFQVFHYGHEKLTNTTFTHLFLHSGNI